MVVISIVVLLMAIALPAFTGMVRDSEKSLAGNQLRVAVGAGRDAAIRSSAGDGAAVFLFSASGRVQVVPCVQVGTLDDEVMDGPVPTGRFRSRDVFVPVSEVEPLVMPRGWSVRAYAGPGAISRAGTQSTGWYENAQAGVDLTTNWVFPESCFTRPTGNTDAAVRSRGWQRQSFLVRFKAGSGELDTPYAMLAPEVDKVKREVAFTVFVDPGRRVYVRRINVGGNTKTRDAVVRREMRQMEGGWYDAAAINRSRTRIDRLGFFDEVNVETPPVPGTTDQVDVNFSVKERPTGNLMLGAGFSSAENIVLSASIAQQNLFGSGNALTLGLYTSESSRTLALSFTNPYYTVDGVSLGWDLYHRTYDADELDSMSPYKTVSTGVGIRLGWPIAEDDQINFGLTADQTEITTYTLSPKLYKDFCRALSKVETYRKQLMNKLALHSIAALTRYAVRSGLASLD